MVGWNRRPVLSIPPKGVARRCSHTNDQRQRENHEPLSSVLPRNQRPRWIGTHPDFASPVGPVRATPERCRVFSLSLSLSLHRTGLLCQRRPTTDTGTQSSWPACGVRFCARLDSATNRWHGRPPVRYSSFSTPRWFISAFASRTCRSISAAASGASPKPITPETTEPAA